MLRPLKFLENRVWRTYKGGKYLKYWNLEENSNSEEDSNYPEDWIASIISANNGSNNKESTIIEGISYFLNKDNIPENFKKYLEKNAKKALGKKHIKEYGKNTGLLMKFIDAAERLSIQVHPDKYTAEKLFKSSFGKTEAWYILGERKDSKEKAHIYAGFKNGVTKDEWKNFFYNQDIDKMLNCLNKYEVNKGDVYLIEGGTPHAIGEGCLIFEIQEPTDYTIRVERKTVSGNLIDEQLIHQGIGFNKMFDCFNWDSEEKDFLKKYYRCEDKNKKREMLISENEAPFSLEKIEIFNEKISLKTKGSYFVLVVLEGSGTLYYNNDTVDIKNGEKIFIPASLKDLTISTNAILKMLKSNPPGLSQI